MIQPEFRIRFEQLGLQVVRGDIGLGYLFEDNHAQHQAVQWVSEQDKSNAKLTIKQQQSMRFWTVTGAFAAIVAAIASIIAAIPIIRGH